MNNAKGRAEVKGPFFVYKEDRNESNRSQRMGRNVIKI